MTMPHRISQRGRERQYSRWIISATILSLMIQPIASWTSTNRPAAIHFPRQSRRSLSIVAAVSVDSHADANTDSLPAYPLHDGSTPLSLTLEELQAVLGGKGRAQACWDCLRLGVDPLWFCDPTKGDNTRSTSSTASDEIEPIDSSLWESLSLAQQQPVSELGWSRSQIQQQITPRRQSQGMGGPAFERLQEAFSIPLLLPESSQNNTTPKTIEDSMSSIAKVVQIHRSSDGTSKLLLQLAKDGLQIECVIIPWSDRNSSSLCLSNQVGCAQACTFCSTGRMGELRSLTADEILVQLYWASKVCRLLPDLSPVNAIVFMGMGEAARNVKHVVRAATQLADPQLFQLAPRRVTISTVAPSPEAFEDLALAPAVLAWSVHASEDSLRKSLVPTTKHSMVELRDSLIKVLLERPRKLRNIMLELALIDGINDRQQDAEHLADFCQAFYQKVPGVKVVVNLIPWNDISATVGPAAKYRKPTQTNVLAFQKTLADQGILCYLRTTRGDDESAACGQLATTASRKKTTKN